jgi:hypothetical protein
VLLSPKGRVFGSKIKFGISAPLALPQGNPDQLNKTVPLRPGSVKAILPHLTGIHAEHRGGGAARWAPRAVMNIHVSPDAHPPLDLHPLRHDVTERTAPARDRWTESFPPVTLL